MELVFWFGRARLRVMVMEYPANATACALGNFAGSLDGAHPDVLAGDGCTFSDIAGGVEGVERNQIACTFADTLGGCSGSFGGAFANVRGAAANVPARAALLGLGCCSGLGGLGVLGRSVAAAEGKGEGRDERRGE